VDLMFKAIEAGNLVLGVFADVKAGSCTISKAQSLLAPHKAQVGGSSSTANASGNQDVWEDSFGFGSSNNEGSVSPIRPTAAVAAPRIMALAPPRKAAPMMGSAPTGHASGSKTTSSPSAAPKPASRAGDDFDPFGSSPASGSKPDAFGASFYTPDLFGSAPPTPAPAPNLFGSDPFGDFAGSAAGASATPVHTPTRTADPFGAFGSSDPFQASPGTTKGSVPASTPALGTHDILAMFNPPPPPAHANAPAMATMVPAGVHLSMPVYGASPLPVATAYPVQSQPPNYAAYASYQGTTQSQYFAPPPPHSGQFAGGGAFAMPPPSYYQSAPGGAMPMTNQQGPGKSANQTKNPFDDM